MVDCMNCGKVDIGKGSSGINATYCSKACQKAWEVENKNSFTTWIGDDPYNVEMRKHKNIIIEAAIEVAVAGSRGARRWLRQRHRIKAIYDRNKAHEVRL